MHRWPQNPPISKASNYDSVHTSLRHYLPFFHRMFHIVCRGIPARNKSGWSTPSCEQIHYYDVIMGTIASQITSLTIVYSGVYSDADQSKHQSSASLDFMREIHRDRWISRTNGQWRGKYFHLMHVLKSGPLLNNSTRFYQQILYSLKTLWDDTIYVIFMRIAPL